MLAAIAVLLSSSAARADRLQLERYEPASAGNWFFGVEHPWYSSTRYLAAGLTLDYGHNPLLGGSYAADGTFIQRIAIVQHQLVGHVDLAGSFLDRFQLSLSLPLVLYESGTAGYGVTPVDGVAIADPRLGVLARLYGQADRDAFSLHVGGYLWIPVSKSDHLVGDQSVRAAPQIVIAGLFARHLRWSISSGVLIRGTTSVGGGPAGGVGSELQLRGALGWGDVARTWNVGLEAWLSAEITGAGAFRQDTTGLELLLGAQWNIARTIQVGAAVGSGVASTVGVPDARAIVRLAWAPLRQKRPGDTDGDGIPDAQDLCPQTPGPRSDNPRANGCPDEDRDGVPDAEDLCPNLPPGAHPDARKSGCPAKDSDNDGVPDAEDECPALAAGQSPDPRASGCPAKDSDSDGVPDAEDLCPDTATGVRPDAARRGCPLPDADHDGIPDSEDLCPNAAPGARPDASRKGCPLPDADGDGIPDAEDACPKLAGPADADPKKSGCPKIESRAGSLTELRSVLFATNDHALLPESFPILDELADLLRRNPAVKDVEIAGHADDTGTHEWNLRLSRHRAESVVHYLVKKGVRRSRLHAVGYGDRRPLSADRSEAGRARNRRVEMRVKEKEKK